ncbi:MAG TPA: M23 family metallopeptidase [Pyrinomonadaceae bacterium]|nr:M23 family metallopeptidase [Pyrinomonadaceae bacterium]
MTNNGKFFTFLFSRSSKARIFIKKVDVSKGLIQNGLLSIALVVAFSTFSIGIFGVVNNSFSFGSDIASTLLNPGLGQVSAQVPIKGTSIDYSRPDSFDNFTANSGGPFSDEDMDAEDLEIENQLRVIQTTSDPASIPSVWAHQGKINNEFGFRRSPFGGRAYEFHAGMDIDGERGEIVSAPATGIVTEAGYKGGYGNMVEVDHGNGLVSRYGHMSRVDVQAGDSISRGQPMGVIGSTGRSTGPHLHYELRLGGRPINPRRFLPPEPTELQKPAR